VNLVALEELAEMVQEGKLAVNVGMRVPWEDVMLVSVLGMIWLGGDGTDKFRRMK
jgi:hypothetical protein